MVKETYIYIKTHHEVKISEHKQVYDLGKQLQHGTKRVLVHIYPPREHGVHN